MGAAPELPSVDLPEPSDTSQPTLTLVHDNDAEGAVFLDLEEAARRKSVIQLQDGFTVRAVREKQGARAGAILRILRPAQ